ncbi:MAG: alpha/beta hydrolase, partial [Kiritimatiellia bacterium]
MKRFLFAFVSLLTAVGFGDVVKGIAYDASLGAKGVGDLYRPDGWTAETPVILQIHGGGWTSQDRLSWAGVAKYFTDTLGYACYNIEYRLAPENPWPTGGEDCIKAANYLLSSAFA